jgi:hypothetical protein
VTEVIVGNGVKLSRAVQTLQCKYWLYSVKPRIPRKLKMVGDVQLPLVIVTRLPPLEDKSMAQPGFAFPVFTVLNGPANRTQQRVHERRFVRLPAWMIFYRHGFRKHVTMVRDLNRNGIYFYSNLAPLVGTYIEFVMKFPKWTNLGPVACKGKVLRVEQPECGAAIGVAVKLSRFWVLRETMESAGLP